MIMNTQEKPYLETEYLRVVYKVGSIPDLTLLKYPAMGIDSMSSLLDEQERLLRRMHFFGLNNNTCFHLLFYYDPSQHEGRHLCIYLYATAEFKEDIDTIRNLIEYSPIKVLYSLEETSMPKVGFTNTYYMEKRMMTMGAEYHFGYESERGISPMTYHAIDSNPSYYGNRLYQFLKTMEGWREESALRIDAKPVICFDEYMNDISDMLHDIDNRNTKTMFRTGSNGAIIQNMLMKYTDNVVNSNCFRTNIISLSNNKNLASLVIKDVASETSSQELFLIKEFPKEKGKMTPINFCERRCIQTEADILAKVYSTSIRKYVSVFGLKELKCIFSLPVLNDGEHIQCPKETQIIKHEDSETIQIGTTNTGNLVNIPVKAFSRHAFLTGMTGSGKTNCMFSIIKQLWETHHIPFLIIEPVKREYRQLLDPHTIGLKNVLFFSPGTKALFDLHINPFEFPIGTELSVHMEYLMNTFSGAFFIPTPGPRILGDCIASIYRQKDWDYREINEGKKQYPLMQDLYDAVDKELQKTTYTGDFLSSMGAILRNRIGSLCNRRQGDIYNSPESTISPDNWIQKPIILELEDFDEGESNFMTLLITTYIRETLSLKNGFQYTDMPLRHILCYEEAHNLLAKKTFDDSSISQQDPNPKIAASAFLEKMLAEMRSLKEGIIIIDQIPNAMPENVIKNTDLKMIFRLVSDDDKRTMSNSVDANEYQTYLMSLLKPGYGFVFFGGMEAPLQIYVENLSPKNNFLSPKNNFLSDELLYEFVKEDENYIEIQKKNYEIVCQQTIKKFQFVNNKYKIIDSKDINTVWDSVCKGEINPNIRIYDWFTDYFLEYVEVFTVAKRILLEIQETGIPVESGMQEICKSFLDVFTKFSWCSIENFSLYTCMLSHVSKVISEIREFFVDKSSIEQKLYLYGKFFINARVASVILELEKEKYSETNVINKTIHDIHGNMRTLFYSIKREKEVREEELLHFMNLFSILIEKLITIYNGIPIINVPLQEMSQFIIEVENEKKKNLESNEEYKRFIKRMKYIKQYAEAHNNATY